LVKNQLLRFEFAAGDKEIELDHFSTPYELQLPPGERICMWNLENLKKWLNAGVNLDFSDHPRMIRLKTHWNDGEVYKIWCSKTETVRDLKLKIRENISYIPLEDMRPGYNGEASCQDDDRLIDVLKTDPDSYSFPMWDYLRPTVGPAPLSFGTGGSIKQIIEIDDCNTHIWDVNNAKICNVQDSTRYISSDLPTLSLLRLLSLLRHILMPDFHSLRNTKKNTTQMVPRFYVSPTQSP
jgi:hypothetical protein